MKSIIVLFLSVALISVESMADDRFTSLRLETNYSFTELSATDNSTGDKLRLLSKSNPGVAVSLAEHWNLKHTTSIKFNYNQLAFKNSELTSIDGLDLSITSFGVYHNYSYSENLRIGIGVFLTEDFYIRLKSTTPKLFTIDKFLNPQLKLDTEYDIFKTSDLTFGGAVHLDVSAPFTAEQYEGAPGNYSVDPAVGYGATVYGRKFFKSYSLEGSLFIKNKSAHTSITDQNTLNQGVALRIAIPFGYEK